MRSIPALALLLAACGHDTTALDVQFVAAGNEGQRSADLGSHRAERVRIDDDHELWVYARFSEWHDDATTFDAARVARIRRGDERIDVPFAVELFAPSEPPSITPLPATIDAMWVEQRG